MEEKENEELKKYDRQIRLFGVDTQHKLINTTIVIVQTNTSKKETLISGEILKNVLLLGVNKIFCNKETLDSFYKLSPNSIKDLNKSVNLSIISKKDVEKDDFINCIVVLVDTLVNLIGNDKFFICSGCYSYHNTLIAHSVCEKREDPLNLYKECMIGAFFVNDLINFIKDKKGIEGFTFPEI